jgi:hypothetical protein
MEKSVSTMEKIVALVVILSALHIAAVAAPYTTQAEFCP